MSALLSRAALATGRYNSQSGQPALGPIQRLTKLPRIWIGLRQKSLERLCLANIYLLHHHR
jgi:hypothetical protein